MKTAIKHIPDPHGGWYLCGHRPTIRRGIIRAKEYDKIRACKRCEQIARQRGESAAVEGDLLGQMDPHADAYSVQEV